MPALAVAAPNAAPAKDAVDYAISRVDATGWDHLNVVTQEFMVFRHFTPPNLSITIAGLAVILSSCDSKKLNSEDPPATQNPKSEQTIVAPDDEVHATYAGSASCKECHEDAFKNWQHSHHGMAERNYDPKLDQDAFSPKQTLKHGNQTSEAFLDADGFAKVLTLGLENKRRIYPVTRIIGHDPLRQFLIPAPGGRLQTCDVSYDPHKNELFDVYGKDERLPGDWGAWTGQGMNWNAMCASCHNTRLRKNYDPRTDSYNTTMAEMSVGCESCHGPMKDHVAWQKQPPAGYNPEKKNIKDPTIKKQTADQMLETCAACHARRGEITGDLVPGESFYDHFSLTVTDETDTYHPDGQIRDEDYVYSSFLSSKMHHAGVRCGDCHNPHSNERILPGNMLCMRCHTAETAAHPTAPIINPTQHSHHKDGSSGNDCTSCHMPVTHYMDRDPRRDHSFSVPDPLLSKELGIPNACNRCHTDKDTDWAVENTEKWYGDKMDRPSRKRALLVASARRGEASAREGLIELLKTEPTNAWKATICHLLERWVMDEKTSQALVAQLKNDSPLVREAALRSLVHLTRENNNAVRKSIEPLLNDPIRSVRVAAAWALVDTLELKSTAGKELVHMLDHNSDQPLGRMQLSQFAYLRGSTESAVRQIQTAIKWDPNSPPFHHDLAILLSMTGDTKGAIKALEDAIALDPNEPEYHYKIALAWSEAGNIRKCIKSLQNSLSLDPSNARAWYNLGLAHNSLNQPSEAINALLRAEAADPNDESIPYARATIHARLGQRQQALEAATRAIQIRQNFPEAIQLIRAISR